MAINVNLGIKTPVIHVPIRKKLADEWSAFRKAHGLKMLANDVSAVAAGMTVREYLMDRALTEYMASHKGGK